MYVLTRASGKLHLEQLWCPREELNLDRLLRREASYPLNDEGFWEINMQPLLQPQHTCLDVFFQRERIDQLPAGPRAHDYFMNVTIS